MLTIDFVAAKPVVLLDLFGRGAGFVASSKWQQWARKTMNVRNCVRQPTVRERASVATTKESQDVAVRIA